MLKRLTSCFLSAVMFFLAFPPAVYASEITSDAVYAEIAEENYSSETSESDSIVTETLHEENADSSAYDEYTSADSLTAQLSAEIPSDFPDNFTLLQCYVEQSIAFFGTSGKDRLSPLEQDIYTYLSKNIADVAQNGGTTTFVNEEFGSYHNVKLEWTNTELGYESIPNSDDTANQIMELFSAQFDFDKIIDALLHDNPLNCYWLDKTTSVYYKISISLSGMRDGYGNVIITSAAINKVEFDFPVSDAYETDSDELSVNGEIVKLWAKCSEELEETALYAYENYTDTYSRLLYFKDYICDKTHYNHSAADGGNFAADATPWQIIGVFDPDNTAGVVCEGYSKTFQQLCDKLNSYDDSFICYTVTGLMDGGTGAGLHMWNIVNLDGENYIADITNCDSGTIGQNGELFMACADGSVNSGYNVNIDGYNIAFSYDEATLLLFDNDVLEISDTEYPEKSDEPDTPVIPDEPDPPVIPDEPDPPVIPDEPDPPVVPDEPDQPGIGDITNSGQVSADVSWTADDTDSDGVADRITVSGSGDMPDFDDYTLTPWYSFADNIISVVIGDGITSAGKNAFRDFSSLKNIDISQTVTHIGDYAFFNCDALTTVTIPGNVESIGGYAFGKSDSLKAVVMENGVKSVGTYAFGYCSSIETLVLPDSITEIGNAAFCDLTKLESVNIPANITKLGIQVFSNCQSIKSINIPDGVTSIGAACFRYCKSLEEISLPSTLESLDKSALLNCDVLTKINYNGDAQYWYENLDFGTDYTANIEISFTGEDTDIAFSPVKDYNGNITGYRLAYWPDAEGSIVIPCEYKNLPVISIGANVFKNNDNITSVVIPEGIKTVENEAFYGCDALEEISFPNSLVNIADNAFDKNKTYKKIYYNGYSQEWVDRYNDSDRLPSAEEKVFNGGKMAFEPVEDYYGNLYQYNLVYWDDAKGDLVIPAQFNNLPVGGIGAGLFRNNLSITSVVIPKGIISIGADAFKGCDNLEILTVPDTIATWDAPLWGMDKKYEAVYYDGDAQYWVDNLWNKPHFPDSYEIFFIGETKAFIPLTDSTTGEFLNEYGLFAWNEASGDVVIPSNFRGYPVTEIRSYAFENCPDLTSVQIPESIWFIGENAFIGCTSLKEVKLPKYLWFISQNAFKDCTSLKEITVSHTSHYEDDNYIYCTYIGENAFSGCTSLEKVYYPSEYNWNDGDVLILNGNEYFENAEKVFATDWGFEFYVDSDEYIYIIGKVNIPERLIIPQYLLGYEVKEVSGGYSGDTYVPAFNNCPQIKSVVISEGVNCIDLNVFDGSVNIEKIVIPSTFEYYYGDPYNSFIGISRNIDLYLANYEDDAWFFEEICGFTNTKPYTPLEKIEIRDITIGYKQYSNLPSVVLTPAKPSEKPNLQWSVDSEYADIIQLVSDGKGGYKLFANDFGTAYINVTDTFSGQTAKAKVNVTLPEGAEMKIIIPDQIENLGLQPDETIALAVSCIISGKEYTIPAEKLKISCSDSNKILIGDNGSITSRYHGKETANVTVNVMLENDYSKSADYNLKLIDRQCEKVMLHTDIPAEYSNLLEITYNETNNIYCLSVPDSVVANGTFSFNVFAAAEYADGTSAVTDFIWNCDNSKTADISVSDSLDSATVTVKQIKKGSAEITVAADDIKKASAKFIINVINYTPALSDNNVIINSYNEAGAELGLSPADGSVIIPDTNGDCVKLIGDDNFCAEYDTEKGAVVIKSADIVKNNSRGVKLSLLVNTTKGSYQLPLTVKVANKLPTVSVKQQGNFNSFFKDSKVIATLISKDAEIESVIFKDTPTFTADFTFAEGTNPAFITVGWADEDNPSSNFVNGKADTSAVLEVHFKDYRETVAVRYTVKVRETKPTLVQSRSTSKLTCFSTDNSPISVTNKLGGALIDFDTSQWQFVSDSSEYVNITSEGTNLTIRPILNDKNKFANGKTSHTVKLEICEDNWLSPVTISHTITVSTSKPVIKAKSTSATLCTLYSDSAAFIFSANPANCPAPQFTVESSSRNASTVREANKIHFATDADNPWQINAYIADSSIKTGSYLYKVTPRLAADDGRVIELKAVTIKVTVSKTAPTVKIKPTSVKLTQTKPQAAVKVTPSTAACPTPVRYKIVPVTANANTAKIGFDYDGWDITAKIIDTSDMPAKMSYKYKITAYIEGADGKEIPLKAINFTVNVAK